MSDQEELRRLQHELRNVLAAIAGNAAIMDRAIADGTVFEEAMRRRLAVVQAEVTRGADILDEMRDRLSGLG